MAIDINTVIENLNELLTNSVNLTDKYYDVFINPTPMMVDLELFNENNELVVVSVPNMAKYKEDMQINNGRLTITRNSVVAGSFTANQAADTTINISVPTLMSQLTNDQNYLDESYVLKYVTDCIWQNGNKVEVTIENNLITLKSGSEVYLPNGTLYPIVTTSDLTLPANQPFSANQTYLLYGVSYNNTTITSLRRELVTASSSGTELPDSFTGEFYNINNQTIKVYSGGTDTAPTAYLTLPIAFVTADSSGNVLKVEQIQEFDTVGFMGSVAYLLPGVTCLIPNGRNTDGTLKNMKVVNNSLKLADNSVSLTTSADRYAILQYDPGLQTTHLTISSQGSFNQPNSTYYYDKEHNLYVLRATNEQLNFCIVAKLTTDTTTPYQIQKCEVNPPFRAANFYDVASSSLSNLTPTGQAILDGKAEKNLSNVTTIDNGSAVKTALDTKVNKSGDTMTGQLVINPVNTLGRPISITQNDRDSSIVLINGNDSTLPTAPVPTDYQLRAFRAVDKDNHIIGDIRFIHDTDDSVSCYLIARSYKVNSADGYTQNHFGVRVEADGTLKYSYSPAFRDQLRSENFDWAGQTLLQCGNHTTTAEIRSDWITPKNPQASGTSVLLSNSPYKFDSDEKNYEENFCYSRGFGYIYLRATKVTEPVYLTCRGITSYYDTYHDVQGGPAYAMLPIRIRDSYIINWGAAEPGNEIIFKFVPSVDTAESYKVYELAAIVGTHPATCNKYDKYFNTASKKIFTATDTNTWGNIGEDPVKNSIFGYNYMLYTWNGEYFVAELLELSDTAPVPRTGTNETVCVAGDRYYNTNSKKIFTATSKNTWGTHGRTPQAVNNFIRYLDKSTNTLYKWQNNELVQA